MKPGGPSELGASLAYFSILVVWSVSRVGAPRCIGAAGLAVHHVGLCCGSGRRPCPAAGPDHGG
jgi:hypothetical protein